MRKNIFIFVFFIMCSTSMSAQAIMGSWSGKLNLAGQQLGIEFVINNYGNTPQVLMNVPEQGAKGGPAKVNLLSKDSLKVAIEVIHASYEGKIEGDVIIGNFMQSGMTFPLTLRHSELELVRPQTPTPPFPYETQEVTFENKKHAAKFHGTLTLPVNYKKGVKPAVLLFVTGSGIQDRDETIMGHKPFAVIADALAKAGFASFRYDDRGFGAKDAELKQMNITTELNVEDANCGLEWLRSQKQFSKIGILGHSEGGTIAFMLGKNINFLISLAGGALPGDSILLNQNYDMLSMMYGPQTAKDYCSIMADVLTIKKTQQGSFDDYETASMKVASIQLKHNIKLPEDLSNNLAIVLSQNDPWVLQFIKSNPSTALQGVKCPIMAIGGSKDIQVNAQKNLAAIKKLVPKDCQRFIKNYAGLNHLFQHCTTGIPNEYGTIQETISPEVLNDIVNFIKSL